jgi:hypothetical protein
VLIVLSFFFGAFLIVLPSSGESTVAQGTAEPDEVFARYARYGADVWAKNPGALISGEGGACISCHTSLPYALVEPLLPGSYSAYTDLIENVDNRVLTWSENTAWYSDEKLVETAALSGMPAEILVDLLDAQDSRGVEAVLNALIRTTHNAYAGSEAEPETRQAFENMWAEQIQTGPAAGRWHWIQVNLVPWEVADSDLWGASLACVAAGIFPELAPPDNLQLLHDTLRGAAADEEVSLHVKSAVLWCDAEAGGSVLRDGAELGMSAPRGDAAGRIAADLMNVQRDDGGWALRDLGPWTGWEGSRADCCAEREIRSDAYATGFVTLALARNRSLLGDEGAHRLDDAVAWIERQLANPYPTEPRYNRHDTGDADLPEFRNNLYTNAGHMWAYLARTVHAEQAAPWARE